ncbi:uncharacterized protein LOC103577268 [Microplitis demolitor]|uniref:uncharacterized protein LOC103577268 n=1 Tax=Microplitis demolitor TaxID=69319 RepID=UPI00235B6612|nr:uncharacterized protein LOC103577268 [Microplitis demolitor]XP_008556063.2 uncharacterized protein LOC103577268 [Microplitis demolitor]
MKRMVEIIMCFLCVSAVQSHLIEYLNFSSSAINDIPISQNHTRKLLELCFFNRMNPVAISKDLVGAFHGITDNGGRNISVITIDEYLYWQNYKGLNFLAYPSFATIILSADYTKDYSFKSVSPANNYLREQFEILNYWSSTTLFLVAGNQCGDASKTL